MTFYYRIARELKNSKPFFLNWPANTPLRLGDYGFYRGRRVEFDWQGNLESLGIELPVLRENIPQDEAYRTAGAVDCSFDLRDSTPACAELKFRKKHCMALETFGGKIELIEIDKLFERLLRIIGEGKVSWNPNFVIVTQR